jgi:hypothetical protein
MDLVISAMDQGFVFFVLHMVFGFLACKGKDYISRLIILYVLFVSLFSLYSYLFKTC